MPGLSAAASARRAAAAPCGSIRPRNPNNKVAVSAAKRRSGMARIGSSDPHSESRTSMISTSSSGAAAFTASAKAAYSPISDRSTATRAPSAISADHMSRLANTDLPEPSFPATPIDGDRGCAPTAWPLGPSAASNSTGTLLPLSSAQPNSIPCGSPTAECRHGPRPASPSLNKNCR